MADTMALRLVQRSDEDYGPQTVIDGEGYHWNFAPNQTHIIPTVAGNIRMSANATVKFGQPSAQLMAPNVNIDDGEGTTPII